MLRKTLIVLLSIAFMSAILFAQQQETTSKSKVKVSLGNPIEEVLIDFANLPGSLAISNRWMIKLSGYSDNPLGRKKSNLREVPVEFTKLDQEWQDTYTAQVNKTDFTKALGIRVYFEYSHGNDWAQIKTKLPIDQFYTREGEGILRNVGPIKSISIWVCGRNYKNNIEVRMVNQMGKYKSINFGNLHFRGWRKITWVNPNYIKDLGKRDIIKEHMYPQFTPYLKFDSIVIYKSPQESGGDFVTYVKDIRIEYEPAIIDYEKAVDDEAVWGIQESEALRVKEKQDKFYDLYFSGSSLEGQHIKDKAQRDKEFEEIKKSK